MSREYAENRIKDALKQAEGNPTKARQQVIAWTYEDTKLLHALAFPHLTGIVAHAVNRVIHRLDIEEGQKDEVLPEMPEALDMAPGTFGEEILRALDDTHSVLFGREGAGTPLRRKKASQSHIDALKQIASKSRNNPDDRD